MSTCLTGCLIARIKNIIFTLFRGFKRFFGRGQGLTFEQKLQQIEQGTGGRVIHRMPSDVNDDWFDGVGVPHPRPVTPPNMDNLLLEVQLNSTRVYVTSHRYNFS